MLAIDCLLKNTEVVDAVKAAVKYIGAHRAKEGKEASLQSVYKTLHDNGIEIDLGSTAHIYSEVLSTKNHPYFNTHEEVQEIAGRYFDDMARALLLRENKKGEMKISELSPAEAVVKKLSEAFTSPLVKDERTKSILKTMQDAYDQYARKLVGPKPEDIVNGKDTRNFEQVIKDVLDKENLGYVDKTTGAINNFDNLHAGAKELMKKLSREVDKSGDPILKEKWEAYAKSFEDSVRTLIFSTKEGERVLHDALKTEEGGGYVKQLKDGTEVLDRDKLAGDIGSINQYRENVISALKAKGFTDSEASKTADSLQKEYFDLRGKSMELLRRQQEKKEQTFTDTPEGSAPENIGKMVSDAVKRAASYESLVEEAKLSGAGHEQHSPKVTFSKFQQSRILHESLKSSEYNKEVGEDGQAIDWEKIAVHSPSEEALLSVIKDKMIADGVKPESVDLAIKTLVDNGIYEQFKKTIEEHSLANLDAQQKLLSKERVVSRKSEMTRLAELTAMGIFDGAHDDLLHHVLGIDSADQDTRKKLISIMDKKQTLIQQFGGNDYLHRTLNAELQHEVNDLIEKNIADKSKAGKVAKALYDFQNLVNMGIIANPFNIAENVNSGFIANLSATLNVMRGMGLKEGVKVMYEAQRLWAATFKDVARGGVSHGLESGKFTQGSSLTDKLVIKNWKNLNPVQKVVTLLTAYAHAGLNAMDSANKVSIQQKTTMLNLHKALTEIPDQYGHKMSKDEATEYLNEKIFGKSLEDARVLATKVYGQLGLPADKNNIERSARELVQANLFSDNGITNEVIEAAITSAYKVASIQLGHEASDNVTGFISGARLMKGLQNQSQKRYNKLIDEGKYGEAATHRILVQTMLVNGVFKFGHGVANWMVLRPLTGGIGLITGGISKVRGSDIIDYTNKSGLEEAFTKTQQANIQIMRACVGLSWLAMNVGAIGVYGMLNDEKKGDGSFEAGLDGIEDNPILNKAVNKFGADILVLMYNSYTAKNARGYQSGDYANWQGFVKYVSSLTNTGTGHSLPEQVTKVGLDVYRDTRKSNAEAAGISGNIIKTFLPGSGEVPFFRSFQSAYYLAKWPVTGEAELPEYYHPREVFQGVLNNGVFNLMDEYLETGIMYPYPNKKD